MKRKFIDEISIDEMQKMRDAGMTNQDIANALDVSYQTVLKYIGQQPSGLRRRYIGIDTQRNEEYQPCLEVTRRVVDLKGKAATYSVRCDEITIQTNCGDSVLIAKDQINQFISELKAIKRHIEKENNWSEMW